MAGVVKRAKVAWSDDLSHDSEEERGIWLNLNKLYFDDWLLKSFYRRFMYNVIAWLTTKSASKNATISDLSDVYNYYKLY